MNFLRANLSPMPAPSKIHLGQKDLSKPVTAVLAVGFLVWLIFAPGDAPQTATISRADHVYCTMVVVDEYPIDGGYSLIDQLITDRNRKDLLRDCDAAPRKFREMASAVQNVLARVKKESVQQQQPLKGFAAPQSRATDIGAAFDAIEKECQEERLSETVCGPKPLQK